MSTEIRRADPKHRRLAALLMIAVVLGGVLALGFVRGWLSELEKGASGDPAGYRDAIAWAFGSIVGVNCVLILGFSAYLWLTGSKVRKADMFPHSSAWLIRDTRIVRGPAAQVRGRVLQGAGVLLAASAAGLAAMTWRLLSRLP